MEGKKCQGRFQGISVLYSRLNKHAVIFSGIVYHIHSDGF